MTPKLTRIIAAWPARFLEGYERGLNDRKPSGYFDSASITSCLAAADDNEADAEYLARRGRPSAAALMGMAEGRRMLAKILEVKAVCE